MRVWKKLTDFLRKMLRYQAKKNYLPQRTQPKIKSEKLTSRGVAENAE
jgi:hypothetical protein